MSEKRYLCLRAIYRFGYLYLLTVLIYLIVNGARELFLLKAVFIGISVVVSMLVIRKNCRMSLFVVSLCLSAIPMLVICSSGKEYLSVGVTLLVLLIYTIVERAFSHKEMMEIRYPFFCVIGLITYALASVRENLFYQNFSYWSTILFLLFFLEMKNVDGRYRYFQRKQIEEKNEQGQRLNRIIMRAILMVTCVMMLLGATNQYSNQLGKVAVDGYEQLMEWQDQFIHWFFDGNEIRTKEAAQNLNQPKEQAVQLQKRQSKNMQSKEKETTALTIIFVLEYVVAGIMILVILLYTVHRLRDCYYSLGNDQQKAETPIGMIVMENEKVMRPARQGKTRRENHSANGQIRKLYRKLLLSSTNRELNPTHTPTQAEQTAGLYGREEIKSCHKIYEKARYGKTSCEKDEVETMKRLVKQIQQSNG